VPDLSISIILCPFSFTAHHRETQGVEPCVEPCVNVAAQMSPAHTAQEDSPPSYLTSSLTSSMRQTSYTDEQATTLIPLRSLSSTSYSIASRWWEELAQEILRTSSNHNELITICKFDLFEDPMASVRALSKQPVTRLENLLATLRGSRSISDDGFDKAEQTVNNLRRHLLPGPSWDANWFLSSMAPSDDVGGDRHTSDCRSRKAEQIVRIVRGQPPSDPKLDVGWLFSAMASPLMDVSTIAEKLDWSFCSIFCRITYYGWARWVLGYRHDGILSYLDVAFTLRNNIFRLLCSAPLATLLKWRSLLAVGIATLCLIGY
jgi:hypothetical protein